MSEIGAGGLNPAQQQQVRQLLQAADVNADKTLKGSEVLVFEQAAEAAGIKVEEKDGKIEGYGIERTTGKETAKADNKNMKEAINKSGLTSFKPQRTKMNEIRQSYMTALTEQLRAAETPEDKARIIQAMQTFPKSAGSIQLFDQKIEGWKQANNMMNIVVNQQKASETEVMNYIHQTAEHINAHTTEVGGNVVDALTKELTDLKAAMGERFDKLDAGQLQILADVRKTGVKIEELQIQAEKLLTGQRNLGEQIDNRAIDINLNIANEGNKTRAAIDKLSTQQAQQAELDAIRDAIKMTFVDELADGDTYRDGVRNWITAQMVGISEDPKISHDEKKQLLNALKDMIDTEMIISDADDLRAAYVGVGAAIGGTFGAVGGTLGSGPIGGAVAGAYGATVGGAIGNDLANKANLEGDVQRFQKAVQQAQTGELDPNWKWK